VCDEAEETSACARWAGQIFTQARQSCFEKSKTICRNVLQPRKMIACHIPGKAAKEEMDFSQEINQRDCCPRGQRCKEIEKKRDTKILGKKFQPETRGAPSS